MKKLLIGLLSISTVFALVGCSSNQKEDTSGDSDTEKTEIANPWTEYTTLDEAIKASGIEIEVPSDQIKVIQCMGNEILEVVYDNGTTIRKGTYDDINGDYNAYSDVKEVEQDGIKFTLSGDEGFYNNAQWSDGGYNFVVYFATGLNQEDMLGLCAQVK